MESEKLTKFSHLFLLNNLMKDLLYDYYHLNIPFEHSGDLKSFRSKSGNNPNPDVLKIGFQMVRFSKNRALVFE